MKETTGILTKSIRRQFLIPLKPFSSFHEKEQTPLPGACLEGNQNVSPKNKQKLNLEDILEHIREEEEEKK